MQHLKLAADVAAAGLLGAVAGTWLILAEWQAPWPRPYPWAVTAEVAAMWLAVRLLTRDRRGRVAE